jgi:hypothetical protein
MHPEIARTLVEQRSQELTRHAVNSRRGTTDSAGPSWLSLRMPRWHVSWSRAVLSPAGAPATDGSGRQGRPGKHGSSLVIIISAYRSA